jgi:hypothetical protein
MIFRHRRRPDLLIAITFVIGSTAAGAEVPIRGPMTFEAFDRDGDGMITPDEFAAAQRAHHQHVMQPR